MMRCGRDWEFHPDDLPPMTDSELRGGARIMMVLMVAFFSYWLVSDIRSDRSWLPEYPKLQIQSASVSGLSQHVTWWNITLLTTNPNRNLTVKYESIEPSVYYGDKADYDKNPSWFKCRQIVATKKLERSPFPFFLEKGGNSTSLINFTPVAVLSEDVDHDLATKIKEELALRRAVKFGLRIMLSFTLTAEMPEKYHHGPLRISYFCNQVEFVFAPIDDRTGIFTGDSWECPKYRGRLLF